MKKLALLTLFIGALAANVHAQFRSDTLESVGFSNPDHIDIIRNYRLPDWGYSNFWMDFSFSEDGRVSSGEEHEKRFDQTGIPNQSIDQKDDYIDNDFQISIKPNYSYYHESEHQFFELNTNVNTQYSTNYTANKEYIEYSYDQPSTNADTTRQKKINNQLVLDTELHHYLWDNFFLFGRNFSTLEIDYRHKEQDNDYKTSDETYDFTTDIGIGLGFGRIRNVSPIIRAVRLSERLSQISGQSLSTGQIQSAANQFTRFQSYQKRYDRHRKYFWNDLFNRAQIDRNEFSSAFDLFYLADVLDENFGSRYEGWEMLCFGNIVYYDRLYRNEIPDLIDEEYIIRKQRSHETSTIYTWRSEGRWYHNLSLRQQLNIETSLQYSRYPDNKALKDDWRIQLRGRWLFNIADRWLYTSMLTGTYQTIYYNARHRYDEEGNGYYDPNYHHINEYWSGSFNNSLNWYVENHLALNASLRLRYSKGFHETYDGTRSTYQRTANDKGNSFSWVLSGGIKYYFNRTLF